MYGLKQAHVTWHSKLYNDLRNINFEELQSAPCISQRISGSNGYTFVHVYVQDLPKLTPTDSVKEATVAQFGKVYELHIVEDVELCVGTQLM